MVRLVERHRGLLPLDTVESIWRVIISTFTFVQSPFSVHADLSAGDALMRDSARFHFGFTVPFVPHMGASGVVQAVSESKGDLGLVPATAVAGAGAWWTALEFDTARLGFKYDDGRFLAAGRERYYHYTSRQTGASKGADMLFNEYLWAGYRFADKGELHVGQDRMPFGLLPYASNNFFESIAWYAGYEDTYAMGLHYLGKIGDLSVDAAFFPSDGRHMLSWTRSVGEPTTAPNMPATTAQITMTSAKGSCRWILAAAAPDRLAATTAPMPRKAT